MAELGERMREARRSLGLNTTEMAEKVGLQGRSSWERYERGTHIPNGEILRHMVALGFDANWLLTGRGSMRITDLPALSSAPVIDIDLLEDCLVYAQQLTNEVARDQSPSLIAAEVYNDVTASTSNPDEQRVALKAIMARLRREHSVL